MHGLESFDAWYERTHPRLVRSLVVVCGGDRSLAADAVDEAMVRALERWNRVQHMASPDAWTYSVARNHIRRSWRRRRTERRALERSVPVPEWVDDGQAIELWSAVAALEQREREAVALRYVAGLTERELGVALGVSEGTASSLLSRARAKLRDALGEPAEDRDA